MIYKSLLFVLVVAIAGANEPLPDFRLADVNQSSARFGETVSPRQYLHQVTAFYFGAST